jgi:hypothetical protein
MAGLLLLYISSFANSLIDTTEEVNIPKITTLFFILILLMATQDIAVDGWAISMLSKANVGYASTCQTIGNFKVYILTQ